MSDTAHARAAPTRRRTSPAYLRVTSYVLIAAVFFLLGFLPLWAASNQAAVRLAGSEQGLKVARLQIALGESVMLAQQGDYKQAMEASSRFFTLLQTEIDRREASSLTAVQRSALAHLLTGRDELIAMLARDDPAATARLVAMYPEFEAAVARKTVFETEPLATDAALSGLRRPWLLAGGGD